MSYQVLARKWRPRNFATLVGQEHVVRALTHALAENRLHHAYLFTGTRGIGKTTIARILAKSLNCERGVSSMPCGVCSSCVEIDSGRFVDLLEVDAATNTKVDEMRQLLENAIYAPTRGRYKVYVIDEVHMLSTNAFNAMLKTLEEPPEHVKFILATTDPQKIPVTVLSRCLQFNLKQMTVPAIAQHLARILDAEGVSYSAGALNLIARSASGSMRDALSLLDQAIAHGAGKVEEAQVREMLGSVDLDYLYEILEALIARNAEVLMQVALRMSMRSLSFASALQELALLLTRIQIAQMAPGTVDEEDPDIGRLKAIAGALSPEAVQLSYQIVVQGRTDLALAPDEYGGFVMTLLRLHAFSPVSDVHPGSLVKPVARERAATTPMTALATALPSPSPVMAVSVSEGRALSDFGEPDWQGILSRVKLTGMVRELANHCELRAVTESIVTLRLSPRHRSLLNKAAQDKLQNALGEHFGRALSLRVEIGEVEAEIPAVAVERDRKEKLDAAFSAIESDQFVRDAIEQFDAAVVGASVKPLI